MSDELTEEESWVDYFLASDREGRLKLAHWAIETSKTAQECWMHQHDDRLARFESQRRKASAVLDDALGQRGYTPPAAGALIAIGQRIERALGLS